MIHDTDPHELGRRTVLASAGGLAAFGLAGCLGDGDEEQDRPGVEPGDNESGGNETGGNETDGNETGGNETGGDEPPSENEEGYQPAEVSDEYQETVDSFLDDANSYEGTIANFRDRDETVVMVGSGDELAFEPSAITIAPGTTVTWEWTGQGEEHNVAAEEGAEFESEITDEEGFTFEHEFDEEGVVTYVCMPHRDVGMKGAVVVEERE